jgi:glycosyltransferase involved in cell wall biosynthesis
MSWGCAILVPRTANFIELIGDENYPGFFNLADAGDLARVLGEVLGNQGFREAMVGITVKRAGELFTWEEFEMAAAELLEEIDRPNYSTGNFP